MKQDVLEIAVAGFLHDIGKFIQRIADELNKKAEFKDIGTYQKYQPYNNEENKYTHIHAAYTALFIKDYLKSLPQIENMDKFTDLAAKHHLEDLPFEHRVIQVADRISSGMDRRNFGDAVQGIPIRDYVYTRMISIFERIKTVNNNLDGITTYNERNYQYDIDKLSADNIFPKIRDDNPPPYSRIAKEFDEYLLSKLRNVNTLEEWLNRFDDVCKKYLTFIPSATVNKVIPDISLYDHARTTSAIAQALYVYHKSADKELKSDDATDNTDKKFLYFKAKFNGIQNFIFSTGSQTNKNAAKILRGRSFYVSLLMKRTADILCEELCLAHTAIVMNAAGAITAILPNTDEVKNKINEIKTKINNWLIDKFYGEVSVSFAYVEITSYELTADLGNVSKKIIRELEISKFTKISLDRLGVIKKYFEEGEHPCPYCGKRPNRPNNTENADKCDICADLEKIGESIHTKKNIELSAPVFGKYKEVKEDDYDKLYIPQYEKGDKKYGTKTFDDIVKQDGQKGIDALGVLKADVDNLGDLFKAASAEGGLSRQVTLSRLLDAFWTSWLPNELKNGNEGRFKNIYTIFSGGDDLFLIGRWDTIIDFAMHLNDKFKEFTCHNHNITFSAGIAIVKNGEPVSTFYRLSEESLETSKNYPPEEDKKTKNALTLFEETIPWDKKGSEKEKNDYERYDTSTLWGCYQDIDRLIDKGKLNSGALYKLMSFIDMAKKVDSICKPKKGNNFTYKDMQAFKWKALLTYFIARNDKFKGDNDKQSKINQFIKQIEDRSQRSILKAMLWRNIYENRERRK